MSLIVGLCIAGAAIPGCADGKKPSEHSGDTPQEPAVTATNAGNASMLDFTMNRINGTPEPLSEFKGKVVLIVNVASQCGLTPQYEGLESLYNRKRADGFVILGFPANDFGEQEPGTNAEIATFCTREFGVTFPMFQKVVVTGPDACPLYKRLTAESEAPTWNFTKYLLDREGRLVKRFGPKTPPDDPELLAAINRMVSGG